MKDTVDDSFEAGYLSFLDEIYHCHWSYKRKLKIQRLREAVQHFWPNGHPTRFIQITGTNGKGSVSHYLECGLGLREKSGSWTGPHLFDYAERFHIGGCPVPHDEIVSVYRDEIEPYQMSIATSLGEQSLGFASLGILIALKLFEIHQVKWGIMEVGAGGRFTPLMALDVAACVLTNIGNDHPVTLGSQLWQRALEKAGIARKTIPFFSGETGEAQRFVRETVLSQGGEYHEISDEDHRKVHGMSSNDIPEFVVSNLALSLAVVRYLKPDLPESELLRAMNTRLKGRFWMLDGENERVIVDVAHNRDKIQALAQDLKLRFPGRTFHFLLGLTRKRNAVEVFEALFPLAESIVFTSASYVGQSPQNLADQVSGFVEECSFEDEPHIAFKLAKKRCKSDDLLVITGSAYMIDQVLNPNRFLAHTNADYGWRGKGSTGTR